jgi:hypothetical protein
MTVLISIAVAVVAWILGRTRWENKLWWVLATIFVLALFALWDVDRVAHVVSAARFGLAFLVGWWLVSSFFGASRLAPKPTGRPHVAVAANGPATHMQPVETPEGPAAETPPIDSDAGAPDQQRSDDSR